MSTQHTPGPWLVDPTGDIGPWIVGNDTDFIADCNCDNEIDDDVTEANARLIAAAPDLYLAVIGLLNKRLSGANDYRLCLLACSGKELDADSLKAAADFGKAVDFARGVIAKAKGAE